ncbi:hypothetical protein V6N12_012290 [Hibiscus sabdariffa]|uniref:MADS-box domain-containing protein n=1 Tax=Hibiscus sabdariffa TaxID=183260 RepID=A0ABR2CI32_9ROSI
MGYKRHPKKRNVDPSSLQMVYSKGRETILKKAAEFSMSENIDVGVMMFSPTGELTTYASKGRFEDMLIRHIEERLDDSDGPIENEEFLIESLKRLKLEAEKMDTMDRCDALQSKLNEINWLKYKAEEKMRLYKPDLSKIGSVAEADCHQAKLLEEEASANRTSAGASTSGRVDSP